jgi:acyl CoA:acetate/3-ketoacid CoA transferase beta subunit
VCGCRLLPDGQGEDVVLAVRSHRPSRLSCIFAFGAALVLAGAALTVPSPARAAGSGSLSVIDASAAVAGDNFKFRVYAVAPGGGVNACFNHTVHVSSTDAAAMLPYDYTFSNPLPTCDFGDLGVHLFVMIPITAGSQTITVTDVTDPTVTSGSLTIDVAPGPAASLTASTPSTAVVGHETQVEVTVRDADSNVATNYTGTVGFTSTDGSATLPGSYTFNTSDAGTHTFTVVFASEKSQTVTVTDTSLSLQTSATTNVVPNGGAFSINCSGAMAGAATPCWVNAQYSDYLVNTGYTGTIHFTSSDSHAAKPADYTFQSTDQGIAPVFYATFHTAGSQTLTVTDTNNSAITGTSYAIAISHAGWDHLGVSPSGATIAAGLSQVYTARGFDAYGNSWDATSETTFTIDSGTACPAHSCTSTVVGTHTVTGTDGWQVSTATLHVTPGSATHLSVSTFAFVAGAAHTVAVKAIDAYGNVATGYRGAIHFTSSDTRASVPADYTFTSADGGVHAFALTLNPALVLRTAGSQWVRATDKTTASITGSQTVTVTPGVATHLSVSTFAFIAGATHTVTVKALDAYGNVAAGYLGAIHFTSSDTKATLPADYAFKAAEKGVHVFSLGVVLKTAGSQWVRATDKVTASITGSQTVTVTPAKVTHLSVSTFNPYVAGATHTVMVKALDAYGNVATGYLGAIHFTSSDTRATLPADYAFKAADKGVHAFTAGIVLRTAGSQWVRATDKVAAFTGSQTITVQ